MPKTVKPKFAFTKGERPTGLSRINKPYPDTYVKLKGKKVGIIRTPSVLEQNRTKVSGWNMSLAVKCDEHPGWRWVSFKHREETEPAMREWANANIEELLKDRELHNFD